MELLWVSLSCFQKRLQISSFWFYKPELTTIEVELITGRYHQIRVQLSALGCPIKGDSKYGAQQDFTAIGLHHKQLTIEHPVKREPLLIVAPLPAEMRWY